MVYFHCFYFPEHDEQLTQMKNKEQEELNRFRKYCQERIDRINKDPNRASAQFAPMDRIYRSVVYVFSIF